MKFSRRIHILFWSGYIAWDVLETVGANMNRSDTWATLSPSVFLAIITACIGLVTKLFLFYFSFAYILRPLLLAHSRPGASLLRFILFTVLVLFIQRCIVFYVIFPWIYHMDLTKVSFFNITGLVFTLFDLLVPVCLLLIYELFQYSRVSKEKAISLEKEKLNSELNFLKAQVNPHFLFNVLGTIHALSRHNAPEAADVTIKLSQLMRFILYEANAAKVPVSREVKIIEDYIDLEQVRFRNKLKVNFIKEIDDYNQLIAPLILLPLVENAFKHGSAENLKDSFVQIHISLSGGSFLFTIENSIEEPVQHETSRQIGLSNVKRQLELIYPRHELIVDKRSASFYVMIKFNLMQDEKI